MFKLGYATKIVMMFFIEPKMSSRLVIRTLKVL